MRFPEIVDLGKFDNSYLEGVRQKLAKTINNVTWLINLNEGKAYLTPEELRVLENQKAYKQTLINYKDAFISYLKQRRKIQEQMWEQEQNQETDEEMFRKAQQKYYGRGIYFYNSPQELLNRLELLDGSLRAGNNGALPEYIQIAHRLRDTGFITNTQLNTLLRKYVDL